MRLVNSTVFLVLLGVTVPATALPEFLDEWRAVYPTSTADDFACQLCHQRPSGGSPWNAYGWNLREAYRDPLNNQTDFGLAVLQVENTDQDGDPLGATAVQEIEIGAQPGWREGSFNTFFSSNGDRLTNQPPPAGLPNSTILDFPTAIQDPISSPISTGLGVGLQEVAGGFNSPVKAVAAPGLSDKIFVVEQTGKIICVDLASGDKTTF